MVALNKTAAEGVCKGMDPEGYSSSGGYVSCTLATKNEAACKAAGGQLSGYVCKIPYEEEAQPSSNTPAGSSSGWSRGEHPGRKPTGNGNPDPGDGSTTTTVAEEAIKGNGYSSTSGVKSADPEEVQTSILDCGSGANGEGIFCVMNNGITVLTFGIGIAATLGIVLSGIQYMTARDSVEQATKARKRIVNILIGLAIYAAAWGFLNFIIPGGIF